jgi:predicted nucleic acid-binding protein
VWLTRGHVGAAQRLHAINPWRISAVTYIELAQGCRAKAELARLKNGLAARHTEVVPITPATGERAAELIDELALSHGVRLADALIGATALELKAKLISANLRHFGVMPGLDSEAFAP